jgi:hypothetical protein
MKTQQQRTASALPAHFDPERVPASMRADSHVAEWVADATRAHESYAQARKIVKTRIDNATSTKRPLSCVRNPNVPDVFHVSGGKDPDGHTVDLRAQWGSKCTCYDHMMNFHFCKHLIRAELENGAGLADRFSMGVRSWGIYSLAIEVELDNLSRKLRYERSMEMRQVRKRFGFLRLP